MPAREYQHLPIFNEQLISQKMWFQIVLSSEAVTKPNLAGKQPRIRHKHDAVHMPLVPIVEDKFRNFRHWRLQAGVQIVI